MGNPANCDYEIQSRAYIYMSLHIFRVISKALGRNGIELLTYTGSAKKNKLTKSDLNGSIDGMRKSPLVQKVNF